MSRFKKHEVENITDWTEWIYPHRTKYKLACCDCGLIHEMDFKIVKNRVQFRARRNNRATGQFRRYNNQNK